MLSLLRIQNVAVIEAAEIEFGAGLNVMTGETGAGKSIVIDSLSAVLGQRTSRELIRTGADSAAVTAVFSGELPVNAWLTENGIEPDEEGGLVVMRRMSREGKTSCRVNGTPVSVSQLKELGDLLINIHGQNDVGRLLDEAYHLDYLDNFGALKAELDGYRTVYQEFSALREEIRALQMDETEKARRIDSLQFQITELERANLKKGEMESLLAQRDLQKNAGKLTEALSDAFYALYGGERSDGAMSLLSDAKNSISRVAPYAAELPALKERLHSLCVEAEDVAEQLRDMKNSLDFSPADYERLEERLDQIKRLSRKYGPDEEAMLAYLEACRTELDTISDSAERLLHLEKKLEGKRAECISAGEILAEARRAAALRLQARITEELNQLSMPGVRFQVEFAEKPGGFDQDGLHDVRFIMSANAGEAMGRISRIASGGELARIMLAMKNVLAAGEGIPTLVFDEIDTGVSGIAAQRVGEKLSQLAGSKQVLCVTHLPQIAAMGDMHFSITKSAADGRTYTHVTPLEGLARRQELARLYGGENITETTLTAAEEQLQAAERFKGKVEA